MIIPPITLAAISTGCAEKTPLIVVPKVFIAFITVVTPLAMVLPVLNINTAEPIAVIPEATPKSNDFGILLTTLLTNSSASPKASTNFGTAFSIVHFARGNSTPL